MIASSKIDTPSLSSTKIPSEGSTVQSRRSYSSKKQYISIITPSLQQQNYIRSIQEIINHRLTHSPQTRIVPLEDLLTKKKQERKNSSSKKGNKQWNPASQRKRNLQIIILQNQQNDQSAMRSTQERDGGIWSLPQTPINQLLKNSYIIYA